MIKFKVVALKRATGFVSYLYCTISDQSPNLREEKRYWKKDFMKILSTYTQGMKFLNSYPKEDVIFQNPIHV